MSQTSPLLILEPLGLFPVCFPHQIVYELLNCPKLGGTCVRIIADDLLFAIHHDHRESGGIVGDHSRISVFQIHITGIPDVLCELVEVRDRHSPVELSLALSIFATFVTEGAIALDNESVGRACPVTTSSLNPNLRDAVIRGSNLSVAA